LVLDGASCRTPKDDDHDDDPTTTTNQTTTHDDDLDGGHRLMAVHREGSLDADPVRQGDAPTDAPASGGLTRRRILVSAAGVGALSLAGPVLVACGSDDGGTTPSTEDTSRAPSGDQTTGTGTGTGEDAIATTDQVPQGGGLILTDQKIVITQPESGEFKAFTAVCTHQGCTVGSVKDNVIMCPCHGSQYDAATGEVINGPAPKGLAEKTITVEGDQIVLS
jgi:Rieske Fe-S protein